MSTFELLSIIASGLALLISAIGFGFSIRTFLKEKPRFKIKVIKFEKFLNGGFYLKLNVANVSLKSNSIRGIYLKHKNSYFSQMATNNNLQEITDIFIPYYQSATLDCYFDKLEDNNEQTFELIIDTPLKCFTLHIELL